MIMAARLRRRSGMEPDMQNWLGFGILTKRWCLPARCIKDGCKNVFSAEDVIQAPNNNNNNNNANIYTR